MKRRNKFIAAFAVSFAVTTAALAFLPNCEPLGKEYDNYILEYADAHENKNAVSPLEYYGYKHLSEQKNSAALLRAYNKIAEAVQMCKSQIWLYNAQYPLTIEEVELVYYCYRLDYPQSFWVENEYSVSSLGKHVLSVQYNYSFTKEQLPAAKETFENAVADILVDTTGLADAEKEEYIYKYIIKNVRYSSDSSEKYADSAYGALINKIADCEGQAELFLHLAREAGLPCMIVYGEANGGEHAWNIILVDGEYYNVDVTWDGYYTQATQSVSHRYYNVKNNEMTQTHQYRQVAYKYPLAE